VPPVLTPNPWRIPRIRRWAMFEPDGTPEPDTATLEEIRRRAPAGALAIAGIATALVFALWFVFYLAVFLPRGLLQ
jgi:hypothetical protein